MPRAQRLYRLTSNFSAGQLSPAAQSDLTRSEWAQGAAELLNFTVRKDGGILGRGAFRRADVEIPVPRYDMLHAGMSWRVPDPARTGLRYALADGGPIPAEADRVLAGPPDEDGVVGFPGGGLQITIPRDAPILNTPLADGSPEPLLTLYFVDRPARAWNLALHGVQLSSTDQEVRSGQWRYFSADGTQRLTFKCYVDSLPLPLNANVRSYPTARVFDEDGRHAVAHDEFGWGELAPGRVPRDVVLPLDARIGSTARWQNVGDRAGRWAPPRVTALRIQLSEVRVGDRRDTTILPLTLHVGGVSCLGVASRGAGDGFVPRTVVRVLPWRFGGVEHALVLGLNTVELYRLPADLDEAPERVSPADPGASNEGVWGFTARQLRELSFTAVGSGLLLAHRDFPHPLIVESPTGVRPFRLRSISDAVYSQGDALGPLTGIAVLPRSAAPDLGLDVGGATRSLLAAAQALLASPGPGRLSVRWRPVQGTTTYRVEWDTKASFDASDEGRA